MNRNIALGLISIILIANSSLCMDGATSSQGKSTRVVLACAGTASVFDEKTFHEKLLTLYNLPADAIELKDQSLSAEEKALVKASLLSYVAVILHTQITDEKLSIDPALITALPTKAAAPIEPTITKPRVLQRFADPITLTFGVGCALATWFAVKNLNPTTE